MTKRFNMFGKRVKVSAMTKNWRSKSHPYYFRRRGTIQVMAIEIWWS